MDARELRQTLVLANAFKEGDLAIGGTADDKLREEARQTLLGLRLGDIRRTPLVEDGVTEALARSSRSANGSGMDQITIANLKTRLLGGGSHELDRDVIDALPSEGIAAVVKVLSEDELAEIAHRRFNRLPGPGIQIGSPGHFGSRIQPNSPGDDEEEILFSILEGLTYGCGDVIIGLNPAADSLETIVRLEQLLERVVTQLELPTRYCVLSDIVKQDRARESTRVDVGFQSLAGTSRALYGMVGLDLDGITDLAKNFDALYFETGQGSAITNGTAEGVDMVTLEARAYGAARHIRRITGVEWMIVNDVSGFIGPEVFKTAEQLERVCLEDCVMAKLHGLTMGLDVCATFHMGIPPKTLRRVTDRVVRRACPAYLMAVAGNADPMLGYLTTSFREHPALREPNQHVATPMQQRLIALGLMTHAGALRGGTDSVSELYAIYTRGGGDRRAEETLRAEGRSKLARIRERGFDLGYGGKDGRMPSDIDSRLEKIYEQARTALYARVDQSVLRDACSAYRAVRTASRDREDFLSHPATGERLREADARELARSGRGPQPEVQIVISDGLNGNAANEHLRALLPAVRALISQAGHHVGETEIVVENGRVRAGYQIGGLLNATSVVHIIGERPGTGLNTLSAYLTYGRDEAGALRWDSSLDHSCTTAVCGIHPKGKPPEVAAVEIADLIHWILQQRRSGIALRIL